MTHFKIKFIFLIYIIILVTLFILLYIHSMYFWFISVWLFVCYLSNEKMSTFTHSIIESASLVRTTSGLYLFMKSHRCLFPLTYINVFLKNLYCTLLTICNYLCSPTCFTVISIYSHDPWFNDPFCHLGQVNIISRSLGTNHVSQTNRTAATNKNNIIHFESGSIGILAILI